MGQIADDMVDGLTCSKCTMFFYDENGSLVEHGYPCLCWDCWHTTPKRERSKQGGLPRALYSTEVNPVAQRAEKAKFVAAGEGR